MKIIIPISKGSVIISMIMISDSEALGAYFIVMITIMIIIGVEIQAFKLCLGCIESFTERHSLNCRWYTGNLH